jgi:hypothetical protein
MKDVKKIEVETLIRAGWTQEMVRLLGPGHYQILRCRRSIDEMKSYQIFSDAWGEDFVRSVRESIQWRILDQKRKLEAQRDEGYRRLRESREAANGRPKRIE